MQPRFSIQIVGVISLCLTVLAAPMAAVDCADWNSEEYFEAATAADLTDCLRSGADLKARTKAGNTLLHWAASYNENPVIITALLDAGADPKARNEDGWTPLHLAAMNNNPAVIAALLDAGDDLKAWDKYGKTPLHWAAWANENPAVIAALLDSGADSKARDKLGGKTPWDYAKDREPLKGSDAYWRLNEAQF